MPGEQLPQPETLDTYELNGRSLQAWHDYLTHDAEGNYTGNLDTPDSNYGRDAEACSWHAISLECVFAWINGGSDAPAASMDYSMGLVVNNSDYVETGIYDYRYAIPDALKEKIAWYYGRELYRDVRPYPPNVVRPSERAAGVGDDH